MEIKINGSLVLDLSSQDTKGLAQASRLCLWRVLGFGIGNISRTFYYGDTTSTMPRIMATVVLQYLNPTAAGNILMDSFGRLTTGIASKKILHSTSEYVSDGTAK